jgi:hypothetical protein
MIFTLTMHALGRRLERGRRDIEAVFADLAELAWRFPTLIEAEQFRCPCPDGTWVGNAALCGGRDVALSVATFHPEILPMLPTAPRDIESLLATLPALSFPASAG